MSRLNWSPIIDHAATIVASYDTSVTLRQLFYRLVSDGTLPNRLKAYKHLSELTAQARRDGTFPDLIDRGRAIHRPLNFTSPDNAMDWLRTCYRRDRTEGQDVSLYLGVEKAGMVIQLESWFGHLGIPILALGGYASQSYVDDITADVADTNRPAILLYAGDFDPSGEDIDRDFLVRTDCWDKTIRVALNTDQVRDYRLPINPGKTTDSRAAGFIERHGTLMQVELDALDPDDLHRLFDSTITQFWDMSRYEQSLARENHDRQSLA